METSQWLINQYADEAFDLYGEGNSSSVEGTRSRKREIDAQRKAKKDKRKMWNHYDPYFD